MLLGIYNFIQDNQVRNQKWNSKQMLETNEYFEFNHSDPFNFKKGHEAQGMVGSINIVGDL